MGNNKEFEDLQSYSPEEIEERSGFDRRTIAYYVQEGLLPRVGRRGPNTRYPKPFLDRLLFIKKLKELQEAGRMHFMSLGELAILLDRLPEETIAVVASGEEPLDVVDYRMPGSMSMMSASSRAGRISDNLIKLKEPSSVRYSMSVNSEEPWAHTDKYQHLATLFSQVEQKARTSAYKAGTTSQPWVRTEVTPDITLSVRGLDKSDINTLEETAELLRRLIRDGQK